MTQKLGSHFHHLWRPFLEEARGLSWGTRIQSRMCCSPLAQSTTTRVAPPSRRNAFSCNSAQMRELERNVRKRAALRLQPSTITNRRVGCSLPLACVGPGGHLLGRFLRRPPPPPTPPRHPPAVPTQRAEAPGHGLLPDRRQPFLAAPRSPARCAATAIPVAPGLLVVVVSLRSRRCSCRQKLQPLMSESTSQTPTLVGRFSGDPHRPLLGDP